MKLELHYGALAPKIKEQLLTQGFAHAAKDAERWQKCADAITILYLHDILMESEKEKAIKRLQGRIVKGVSNVVHD